MPITDYSAVMYSTTTGQIVEEIPLAGEPEWTRLINGGGGGTWDVDFVVDDPGAPHIADVRNARYTWRWSVAVLWGDFVCQAGPTITYKFDDVTGVLRLGGTGLWGLLDHRLQVNKNWNPATAKITDASADTSYTNSLPNIAKQLVRDATSWVNRPGSALPIDIPADGPAGTHVREYPGHKQVPVGQVLQELTQEEGGPDIELAPYRSGQFIRHKLMVGDPHLVQPGTPVAFDYGTSLRSLSIDGNGAGRATSVFVKGAGNEREQLTGYASSTFHTGYGWPALDFVDTSHSSATEQATLDSWAVAGLEQRSTTDEIWTAIVRADGGTDGGSAQLGTYWPGSFATYNLNKHPLLADGRYPVRILGMGNGTETGDIKHFLESVEGV